MVAVVQHIQVEQNATFRLPIDCVESDGTTPRNLSGYTGTMEIKASRSTTAELLATAVVTITAATGRVTATIADNLTAAMDWHSGVYDLFITDGTPEGTDKLATGNARFIRAVTD